MKMNLALGSAACLLGLAMGFSGTAHAYVSPSHPCNGNNVGEIFEEQQGPYRYGQAYKIYQWKSTEMRGSFQTSWRAITMATAAFRCESCRFQRSIFLSLRQHQNL